MQFDTAVEVVYTLQLIRGSKLYLWILTLFDLCYRKLVYPEIRYSASKGWIIRKVMGRVGKKQKKNPCKQKGFEKKYMHQTCLKCEKTYF
jgi:hypothetical protein